jgi:hypothetical protein
MNAKISNTVKFKKNSARWRMLKSIMLESLKLNSEINGMWTTYNEKENAARRVTNGSNTLTGGGTVTAPVFCNGTSWVPG